MEALLASGVHPAVAHEEEVHPVGVEVHLVEVVALLEEVGARAEDLRATPPGQAQTQLHVSTRPNDEERTTGRARHCVELRLLRQASQSLRHSAIQTHPRYATVMPTATIQRRHVQ